MAGQLRVTPEQLENRAKECTNQSEEMGRVLTYLQTLHGNLESEWEGNSAEKCLSEFGELIQSFAKMPGLFSEMATGLNAQARKFREADT